MCIAIPPPLQDAPRRAGRWRHLAGDAERLLAAAAALQLAMLLAGGVWRGWESALPGLGLPLFTALATLSLGRTMVRLPAARGTLPPGYPSYAASAALLSLAGAVAGLTPDNPAGPLLLLAGWSVGTAALRARLRWAPTRPDRPGRVALRVVSGLGAVPSIALLGWLADWPELADIAAVGGVAAVLALEALLRGGSGVRR